jgi:predicted Zn-dependent peptidase
MLKTTRRAAMGMLATASLVLTGAFAHAAPSADRWQIPVHTKKLANGLTVVVSPDASSPTVGISVVYKVGMRLEPKTAPASHLFEHLMFQGTPTAPKGVFDKVITSGGGNNNGSTRPDFTNYIETAPSSALNPCCGWRPTA